MDPTIYTEKYEAILTPLAEAVADAAATGDDLALLFLAESVRAIMQKGGLIAAERKAKEGTA